MTDTPNATVEVTHRNILSRIDVIRGCVATLTDFCDGVRASWPNHTSTYNTINSLVAMTEMEIDSISCDYNDHSGVVLLKYHGCKDSTSYFNFIGMENVSMRTNQCMEKVATCISLMDSIAAAVSGQSEGDGPPSTEPTKLVELTELGELAKQYGMYPVHDQSSQCLDYEVCECGARMIANACNNKFVCYSCGEIKETYNDSTVDAVFGRHDDSGVKHGKYDPSRRCRFWIERIQGRETAEIPDGCINAVRRCIARDRIGKSTILCTQIRKYLKEAGYTNFNDHVTLIRKLITGYGPPPLTEHELQLLYHVFNKVMTVFDDIKPAKKYNSPYYPYIVGKIIHDMLPNGRRRRCILECIHMQSTATLVNNDKLMKLICEKVPELTYHPTIKSDFTIFR